MEIGAAQADLRASYVRGGPGAIVSGVVWLIAAITASASGVERGFVTLFFGGILIYPISTLIVRRVLRRSAPAPGNPGGLTVIETVFPMIGGFLAAWLILPYRPDFVFPLCAIAVGAHYFGFRSAYGDNAYWFIASALCVAGIGAIFAKFPHAAALPCTVSAMELIFGGWLTWRGMSRDERTSAQP
jgi:hypothetical protein